MLGVRLDHATINTTNLAESISFYARFLGLRTDWRPDFGFDGAWLYAEDGDYPIVHLIEVPNGASGHGMFNHIAFRGRDLPAYLSKLKAERCWFEAASVKDTPLTQIHLFDPNGVRIEVVFEEPLECKHLSSADFGVDAVGRGMLA